MGHLEAEVKKIIVQLQDNRKVLSEVDVKAIVQSMLQHEVSQLRMSLSEEQNQHKAAIVSIIYMFMYNVTTENSIAGIDLYWDRNQQKGIQLKGDYKLDILNKHSMVFIFHFSCLNGLLLQWCTCTTVHLFI